MRLAILFLAGMLFSCGSDDTLDCKESGKIIGRDLSRWACGGGWFLETSNGDTLNVYFANSVKEKLQSWPDETVPINVRYTSVSLPEDNGCTDFAVDLTCISFIEEP